MKRATDVLGSIAVSLQEASKAFENFARAFGCAMKIEKFNLSEIMKDSQQALNGDYEQCAISN